MLPDLQTSLAAIAAQQAHKVEPVQGADLGLHTNTLEAGKVISSMLTLLPTYTSSAVVLSSDPSAACCCDKVFSKLSASLLESVSCRITTSESVSNAVGCIVRVAATSTILQDMSFEARGIC